MVHNGHFRLGARALKKGSLRREKVDTCLNYFVSAKKKKKKVFRFPAPSLQNGIQNRMSRNACLPVFYLHNLSLSFWTILDVQCVPFRVKSQHDRGWGVAGSLTACSWTVRFCEVGSHSLRISVLSLRHPPSTAPHLSSRMGRFTD